MNNCQRIQENISAYIDAELGPAERRELHEHVAQCAACRRLLEELSQTAAAVRHLPPQRAPQSLAGEVAQRVRMDLDRQMRRRALRARMMGVARMTAMAAALALAMLAGWSIFDAYLDPGSRGEPDGDALAYDDNLVKGAGGEPHADRENLALLERGVAAAESAFGDAGVETDSASGSTLAATAHIGLDERLEAKPRDAADTGRDELVVGLNSLGLNVAATHRLTIRTGNPEQAMQVVTNLANTQMQRSNEVQQRFNSGRINQRAQAEPARNFIHQQGIESVVVVMDAEEAPHEMEKLNDIFGDALAVDIEPEGEAGLAAQFNVMQSAAFANEGEARLRARSLQHGEARPDGAGSAEKVTTGTGPQAPPSPGGAPARHPDAPEKHNGETDAAYALRRGSAPAAEPNAFGTPAARAAALEAADFGRMDRLPQVVVWRIRLLPPNGEEPAR